MTKIIQNPIDFDLIEFRKYTLHNLTKNKEKSIYGIDTETLDGYCKLIADSDGNHAMTQNIDDCLSFITNRRFRSAHNFFFNLNYDVNAIIKFLPKENLKELYEGCYMTKKDRHGKITTELQPHTTFYGKFKIFFLPKKLLRITHNKHVYKFYDIMQFYNTSLEKASQKYLGLEKYIENIDRKVLGSDPQFWIDNKQKIIKYCINDAILTQKLGALLDSTLSTNIDLHPSAYVSKASICKDFVRKAVSIPDILRIPRNALKFAFNSYSGGRFEILKKGRVGKCSLFDINSAYPFNIRNLIDVTEGNWHRVSDFHERADCGFYLTKVMTHYHNFLPLSVPLKNGVITFPVIDAMIFLSKAEIEAYEPYMDIEIIEGWEFTARNIIYPFRDYIDRVYELKKEADENRYEYKLYKILMNSLYGCFYEKNLDKYSGAILSGKLFNPIYASQITANTRIQLFKTAMTYEADVVGFATDSILFKGKPDITVDKKLGGWSLQDYDKATVLRSGVYQIGDTLKNRGIKRASFIETPYGNFKDLFHYIKSKPLNVTYPVIMNRPLTFIEVLLHHKKHTIEDINRFIDLEYRLDINRDYKRIWEDEFVAGIEIFEKQIDSNPLIFA